MDEVLKQKLEDHIQSDERRFSSIEVHMARQSETINKIKDNHLVHLKEDLTRVKTSVVGVVADLKWLKKFFWVVAGASIASVVGAFLNLIFR